MITLKQSVLLTLCLITAPVYGSYRSAQQRALMQDEFQRAPQQRQQAQAVRLTPEQRRAYIQWLQQQNIEDDSDSDYSDEETTQVYSARVQPAHRQPQVTYPAQPAPSAQPLPRIAQQQPAQSIPTQLRRQIAPQSSSARTAGAGAQATQPQSSQRATERFLRPTPPAPKKPSPGTVGRRLIVHHHLDEPVESTARAPRKPNVPRNPLPVSPRFKTEGELKRERLQTRRAAQQPTLEPIASQAGYAGQAGAGTRTLPAIPRLQLPTLEQQLKVITENQVPSGQQLYEENKRIFGKN